MNLPEQIPKELGDLSGKFFSIELGIIYWKAISY